MKEYEKYVYKNLSFYHSGKYSYDRMIYDYLTCQMIGLYEWGIMFDDEEFIRAISIKDDLEKIDRVKNLVIKDFFENYDFVAALSMKTNFNIVYREYDPEIEYDNVLFCICKSNSGFFCMYKTEQQERFNCKIHTVCYLADMPMNVFDELININKLNILPKYDFPTQILSSMNECRGIINDELDILRYMINEKQDLVLVVDSLYKARHNILLRLLQYSLKIPFTTDVKVEGFNKTPDIFLEMRDHVLIGDISITVTPSYARQKKRQKYIDIINYYTRIGKRVIEAFYCIKPNLVDLDFCLKYPRIRFNKPFPVDLLQNYFNEIDELKQLIYVNYDRTSFDNIKLTKFADKLFESHMFVKKDLELDIDKCEFYEPTILPEEEIIDNYKNLLNDNVIFEKYCPKKLTKEDIITGYMELESENLKYLQTDKKYKPSFHLMVPFFDTVKFSNKAKVPKELCLEKEQLYLLKVMMRINSLDNDLSHEDGYIFLRNFAKNFVLGCENDNSLNILNKGEEFLKEYKENYSKTDKRQGFFEYLRGKTDFPTDDEPYFVKRKIIRVPHNKFELQAREFWKKSGTSFKQYNEVEEKAFIFNKEYKINAKATKTTIDVDESFQMIDSFIEYLAERDNNPIKIPDHYKFKEIADHPSCNTLREMMVDEYYPYLQTVFDTRAHKFHKFSSDCYDQLLHFSSFTMNNNRYATFNCGIKNYFTIVCMSYHDKGKDVGQAYLNCGFGPSSLLKKYSKIFGKVNIIEIPGEEDICLYYTNWRRLPGFKLTFLRDSYFSVLSSSVISLMRDDLNYSRLYYEQLQRKYVLRSLISLCSNQQLCEFLMDMRYYQVSLFSLYTSIKELIIDKFKGPYSCAMVGYIVKLIHKSIEFYDEIRKPGTFVLKGIVIDETGKRSDKSVGFQRITFKSFFNKGFVLNEQDLLDDLFVYVHTMKEPSNVFHEEIKALKTITSYEEKYRNLNELLKEGKASNFNEFSEFYKQRKDMGFISAVIYDASRKFIAKLKPDVSKIVTLLNDEKISELTSTKAVIENDRFKLKSFYTEDVTLKTKASKKRYGKKKEKEFERRIKELKLKFSINKELDAVIEELNTIYKPEDYEMIFRENDERTMSELFRRSRMRVKVHDSILGLFRAYKNEKYDKTIQYCNEFIKGNHEVIADICIKAQYGSKREFYVMNLASKVYARVFENFFKELAKICSSEMISVAGDEKIMRMQTILNEAIKYSNENDLNIVYINGDCTKWSASEIMQSFATMIIGFKEVLPEKMFNFLIFVTKKWANKKIQVPQDILQKVFPIIDETEYLKQLDSDYCIESTHNFLQGVFNYCSSLKAVICAEYTQYLYEKIYPDTKTKYFHMEHSDDYAGVLCFEGESDLVKFKTLHTMVMAGCSMTDSVKKTTIQNIMFEFVSLIGFNGSMTYPSIKKTKEVGTNTACIGYAQDMANIGTRTGEVMRIGLPQSCAYYFSRVHNHCIMKAYSCFDGMKNDITQLTNIHKSDLPVELFGETNMLPIFYLLCKGDPNNYRLLRYSQYNNYVVSLIYSEKLRGSILSDETGEFEIWSPYYMFKFENKLIKSIKNYFIQAGVDEAKIFWENNLTYNFYKPTNYVDMENWLKYMYYKRSFALAYNRVSRMQMSLRLSHFTSSECLSIEDIYESEEKRLLNMSELQREVFEMLSNEDISQYDYNMIDFILLKGDDNAKIIYDWYNRVKITTFKQKNMYHTVANRLPYRATKVPIDNTPGNVIESMFAPEKFELNSRRIKSKESLHNDQTIVEKVLFNYCQIIKSDKSVNIRLRALQIIFSILVLSTKKRNITMLSNRDANTINDFLYTFHSTMFSYNFYGQVNLLNLSNVVSFFNNNLLTYDNLKKAVDLDAAIISSLSFLLMYLTYIENCNQEQLVVLINNLYIRQRHRNISVKDYLMNIDPSLFEHKTERKEYLMQLAIVKYIFMNDVSVINYLLQKSTTYQFKYVKEQKRVKEGWVGDCCVLLRTFDKKTKFDYNNNEITMTTQHNMINKALLTFVIGLENIGLKEKTDIFERVSYTKDFLKKYHVLLKGKDKKILYDEETGYYKYSTDEGIGLPIFFKYNIETASNYETGRNDTPQIRFDMKTFTVMVSGFKFFSLPVMRTFFYPVFKCKEIVVNDIYFSKLINYNIKNILLDHNYSINYEEFKDIIITDNFMKRLKKKNSIYTKLEIDGEIIENPLINDEYDFNVYPGEYAKKTIKNKDYIQHQNIIIKDEPQSRNMLAFEKGMFEKLKSKEEHGINLLSSAEETRTNIFESLNLEELILDEEEVETEEWEEEFIQEINPDEIMKTKKQKKYISIEVKRKQIHRLMKVNRWTSARLLMFIIMGDYRNKYRDILHQTVFTMFDHLEPTKERKLIKKFYDDFILPTLPLMVAEQKIGNYLIRPLKDNNVRIFEIRRGEMLETELIKQLLETKKNLIHPDTLKKITIYHNLTEQYFVPEALYNYYYELVELDDTTAFKVKMNFIANKGMDVYQNMEPVFRKYIYECVDEFLEYIKEVMGSRKYRLVD